MGQQIAVPSGAQEFDSWWAYIMDKVVQEHGFAAVVAGLLVSWVLTQLVKMNFPADWTAKKIVWMTRLTAFGTAFVPTLLVWPVTYDWDLLHGRYLYTMVVSGLVVATVVGGLSPAAYKFFMSWFYRFGWVHPDQTSAVSRADQKNRQQEAEDAVGI